MLTDKEVQQIRFGKKYNKMSSLEVSIIMNCSRGHINKIRKGSVRSNKVYIPTRSQCYDRFFKRDPGANSKGEIKNMTGELQSDKFACPVCGMTTYSTFPTSENYRKAVYFPDQKEANMCCRKISLDKAL